MGDNTPHKFSLDNIIVLDWSSSQHLAGHIIGFGKITHVNEIMIKRKLSNVIKFINDLKKDKNSSIDDTSITFRKDSTPQIMHELLQNHKFTHLVVTSVTNGKIDPCKTMYIAILDRSML